jgi:hypothetical protein
VWGSLSVADKEKLTSWQQLALEHADDLLSNIGTAERQPLVAVIEAAARAAEAHDRGGGALRWQFGGGTARGNESGHDLDFIFTRNGEEGGEAGMLEHMVRALADSDAVERNAVTGRARMAVVLAYGAGGDASGDTVAQNRSSFAEGEHSWTPGMPFEERADPARKALMLIKVRARRKCCTRNIERCIKLSLVLTRDTLASCAAPCRLLCAGAHADNS